MKKAILLVAFFFSVLMHAQTFRVGDYDFEILSTTDNTVQINNYSGSEREIVLPAIVGFEDESYLVRGIGVFAFVSKNLTKITIPDNVISIGDSAFRDCNLMSVIIPDSVITIGRSAFESNNLTSIEIPDSVITIGDNAFEFNENLETVIIGDGVTSIGDHAFTNHFGPDFAARGKISSLILGANVATIGDYAFAYNDLTSLIIPESIKSIGIEAFSENLLIDVSIPEGVTTISEGAFIDNQLTSVVVPKSITDLTFGVFGANNLTTITIPDNIINIDEFAFFENPLETVVSASAKPAALHKDAFGFYDEVNDIAIADRSQIDLSIPIGTKALYEAAGWTGFKSVIEDESLSINNIALSKKLDILFNANTIKVFTTNNIVVENIEVYTISGRNVLKGNDSELSTISLSSGVYVMKITTNKGIVTKKFVKE